MTPDPSSVYDLCIIGAGVVGLNIAREISRYQLRICIIEAADDVGRGCTKANSGIVHGGYSDELGSLKAELCVAGNRLYAQLDSELQSLRGKLAGIGAQWQGAGAAAFTQLMTRWDSDAAKIVTALNDFEQNLISSDTAYVASDDAAQSSMNNLQSRLG